MKSNWLLLAASLLAASGELNLCGPNRLPPRWSVRQRRTSATPKTPLRRSAREGATGDLGQQGNGRGPRVADRPYGAFVGRITPSQSKRYMDELERLNAAQLKLWLMTFEEQQAERARQSETFERVRQLSVDNAMCENQASQQAAENINRNSP